MKQLVLFGIAGYTNYLSPILRQLLGIRGSCRHEVTCSRYSRMVVEEYGIFKGLALSLRRIVNCQPYFNL